MSAKSIPKVSYELSHAINILAVKAFVSFENTQQQVNDHTKCPFHSALWQILDTRYILTVKYGV